MSLSSNISEKAALIWAIADKLTGVYKPHEYGEVILPLTVFRRFDCILADTKEAVLEKYNEVKNLPIHDVFLRKAAGREFYNTSKYTFEKLLDDPDNIEANFRDYLNGFSANVRDIIEIGQKPKEDKPISRMSKLEKEAEIKRLTAEMKQAAKMLEFELAAVLRDKINKLRNGK